MCWHDLYFILGFFRQIPFHENGPGLSRHANFETFGSAFLLLFRALTGENINVRC
jgi:hypothetical protein